MDLEKDVCRWLEMTGRTAFIPGDDGWRVIRLDRVVPTRLLNLLVREDRILCRSVIDTLPGRIERMMPFISLLEERLLTGEFSRCAEGLVYQTEIPCGETIPPDELEQHFAQIEAVVLHTLALGRLAARKNLTPGQGCRLFREHLVRDLSEELVSGLFAEEPPAPQTVSEEELHRRRLSLALKEKLAGEFGR